MPSCRLLTALTGYARRAVSRRHASASPSVAQNQNYYPSSKLQPPPWGAGPLAYERVVQPVWDKHCVRCHDANHKQKMNLTATLDAERVPLSYRTLIAGGWVNYFDMTYRLRHHKAEPQSFGTLKSKLWQVIEAGHHGVKLTRDDMHAVKCWIDLNCPLWPDYIQRELRPKLAQQNVP